MATTVVSSKSDTRVWIGKHVPNCHAKVRSRTPVFIAFIKRCTSFVSTYSELLIRFPKGNAKAASEFIERRFYCEVKEMIKRLKSLHLKLPNSQSGELFKFATSVVSSVRALV